MFVGWVYYSFIKLHCRSKLIVVNYYCTPNSLEIQTTVNNTWHEFICGTINHEFRNDTGDPLICDGFQYGIVSHTYRTVELASKTESADQVRFLVINNHRRWINHVIMANNQLGTGHGRAANASPGLAFVLVLMTVVFQLLSPFRWVL